MDDLEHWLQLLTAAVGSFISAAAGIAMRHAHEVQQGLPPPTWRRIALNTPTLIVMGMAGHVAGQWLQARYGMPELTSSVLAANLGYLGPSVVDKVSEYLESRSKKKDE